VSSFACNSRRGRGSPSRLLRILVLTGLAVFGCVAAPRDARALRTHERPAWNIGLGMGYGRGTLETPGGSRDRYQNGAAPQIHIGHQLGQHFMLGVQYEGWMVEFGGVRDTLGVKFRRSLQNFALAGTWFPGNPQSAWGGVYLRGTTGIGWASTAVSEVHKDQPQHNAPRLDEWGMGISASLGYEFRIAKDFATGLSVNFAGFDIGEQIVDRGGFSALLMHLNIYF